MGACISTLEKPEVVSEDSLEEPEEVSEDLNRVGPKEVREDQHLVDVVLSEIPGAIKQIEAISLFSGYYQIPNSEDGAFLIIDASASFTKGKPTCVVRLHINLHPSDEDVKTETYDLDEDNWEGKWTFSSKPLSGHLKYKDGGQHTHLKLTFSRDELDEEQVARVRGLVKIPFQKIDPSVDGSTIFNPVPFSFFRGEYFQSFPIADRFKATILTKQDGKWMIKLMKLFGNCQDFEYHYNSQKFVVHKKKKTFWLLMGTTEAHLTCIVINKVKSAEGEINLKPVFNLVTIQHPTFDRRDFKPNKESENLAKNSGYYNLYDDGKLDLPNVTNGKFVSIVGKITYPGNDGNGNWKVFIGKWTELNRNQDYATDASVYHFGTNMELQGNMLMTNVESIGTLKLEHTPQPSIGSLFHLVGECPNKVLGDGYSFFNPVSSLRNIAGVEVPITSFSQKNKKLEIVSENQIKYEGKEINEFEYIPMTRTLSFSAETKTDETKTDETISCTFRSDISNSRGIVCFLNRSYENEFHEIVVSEVLMLHADIPVASSS